MKGSVRKKRKNAWSYRIDLGTVDGKRKQVEKGGFKTERGATKAMQDVLYHLNNTGDYVENKKVSFHTVYEEFIEREGKATRAYAILKRYDSLYRNHIKDEFGPLCVYQISATMIIDFLNQKRLKYSRGGKIPLSANGRRQKQRHRLGFPLGQANSCHRRRKQNDRNHPPVWAGLFRFRRLGIQ